MMVRALIDSWQIVCSACETAKPREQFRRGADGRYLTQCRSCGAAASKPWRDRNSKRRRAYTREYERQRRLVDGDRVREYDREYQQRRRDQLKEERGKP